MTPIEHVMSIGRTPRSTMDIDVAIQLDEGSVSGLVEAVTNDYFVSHDMVLDAARRGSSFNLMHNNTGMKVDLFALSNDPLDVRQLDRMTSAGGHLPSQTPALVRSAQLRSVAAQR